MLSAFNAPFWRLRLGWPGVLRCICSVAGTRDRPRLLCWLRYHRRGTPWTRLCTGFGAGVLVSASVSVGARTRVPDAASSGVVPHPLGEVVSGRARTRVPDAASSRLVPHPLGAVVAWLEVRRRHLREHGFLLRDPGLR